MSDSPGAPCLVCGAATSGSFPAAIEGFSVLTCDACGSARTWPALGDEAIAAWYPQAYYGNENVRFNPLFERMTRWFRRRRVDVIRRLTAPGSALDVGCGRGFTLAFLRQCGYEVTGVELSAAAAGHARSVLGLDVRTGDFLSQPFAPDSFDVVIFWHSLEHVSNPLAALDRAREILRPGGLLVIAVPNFASIQSRVTERQWFHLDVPRHYTHFSSQGLKRALRERDLDVVQTAHFNLEQNPYGWIQSLLNRVFEHDLLYSILKDRHARMHRLREFPLQSIATSIAGVLLLPVAMGLSIVEAMIRRGGTIEMYARKRSR
jgi:SAM-dependent methyltransferase